MTNIVNHKVDEDDSLQNILGSQNSFYTLKLMNHNISKSKIIFKFKSQNKQGSLVIRNRYYKYVKNQNCSLINFNWAAQFIVLVCDQYKSKQIMEIIKNQFSAKKKDEV